MPVILGRNKEKQQQQKSDSQIHDILLYNSSNVIHFNFAGQHGNCGSYGSMNEEDLEKSKLSWVNEKQPSQTSP